MVLVVLTFLVLIVLAVGVLAVVALPHLRSGSQVLTPEGERALREARARLRNDTRDSR